MVLNIELFRNGDKGKNILQVFHLKTKSVNILPVLTKIEIEEFLLINKAILLEKLQQLLGMG